MPLSVENLCGLLIRSRLQPVEKVKEYYEKWQKQAGDKNNAQTFARWLVENGLVTEYQATLLSNGYADNFFLGDYKILDRIGKGRLAGVYKAVHASGQVVAIKVLPPSKAADSQILKRFEREAQLAEQLEHPNVVRTFHHGESNGLHYIVMEYLEGETLKSILKTRQRLPPVEALRIAYYLGQGLQHLHEKGLVHRELCPENIMLCPAPSADDTTQKCSVKLLDIGLGRALFETKRKTSYESLSKPGEIIGNPEYMAPEQARDPGKADIRSDLYSLGCVLYHMLAGKPPFSDAHPVRLAVLHATEPPPPLKDLGIEAVGELNQLVNKLLAKDPAQRFQTPAQVCEALKQLLGADTEGARCRPESQAMAGYLESLRRGKPSPPVSGTVSAGTGQFPVPPTADVRSAKPPPSVAAVVKKKKTGRTGLGVKKAPSSVPAAAPPKAIPVVNVELVDPSSLIPPPPPAPFGLPMSRDVFLFVCGALGGAFTVLFVVFLVWLMVLLLGGRTG